ncbi:MAG: NADH dehydrogenase [ubiquinone] 1 alpha subcomplex assembly factor 1 [Shewanella sp.]|jgi:NADH dehydrogenase [ubiquinone] 1 alpha subcomplex assembly factor 1
MSRVKQSHCSHGLPSWWFENKTLFSMMLMGSIILVNCAIADERGLMVSNPKTAYLAVLNEQQVGDGFQGNWTVINDTVMGGVSNSKVEVTAGIAKFSGYLSLEQNGGFVSIRTPINQTMPNELNLIRIKVKGDGRVYQLRLRTDDEWDSFSYSKSFKTEKDKWINVEFSTVDFKPVYRGRVIDAPKLSYTNIKQVGFLLADKQPGEFELSFKDIELTHSNKDQ